MEWCAWGGHGRAIAMAETFDPRTNDSGFNALYLQTQPLGTLEQDGRPSSSVLTTCFWIHSESLWIKAPLSSKVVNHWIHHERNTRMHTHTVHSICSLNQKPQDIQAHIRTPSELDPVDQPREGNASPLSHACFSQTLINIFITLSDTACYSHD